MDGRPATLLASVENVNLEVVMAHELAHTVHIQLAGVKYAFGQGNTGMRREAYCAGWIVMGKLAASGRPLAELARVPEAR